MEKVKPLIELHKGEISGASPNTTFHCWIQADKIELIREAMLYEHGVNITFTTDLLG